MADVQRLRLVVPAGGRADAKAAVGRNPGGRSGAVLRPVGNAGEHRGHAGAGQAAALGQRDLQRPEQRARLGSADDQPHVARRRIEQRAVGADQCVEQPRRFERSLDASPVCRRQLGREVDQAPQRFALACQRAGSPRRRGRSCVVAGLQALLFGCQRGTLVGQRSPLLGLLGGQRGERLLDAAPRRIGGLAQGAGAGQRVDPGFEFGEREVGVDR